METHQKDIEEKDPFGQNRRADEAEDDDDDEKSFLKALLAERALKYKSQKKNISLGKVELKIDKSDVESRVVS